MLLIVKSTFSIPPCVPEAGGRGDAAANEARPTQVASRAAAMAETGTDRGAMGVVGSSNSNKKKKNKRPADRARAGAKTTYK